MHNSKLPSQIKVGLDYTTSWANNRFLKWRLIDVTNNQAYLRDKNGKEFSTHVNTLRQPNV